MPPLTEGFHVLKSIGSFMADGNTSDKIAHSKEQTTTRELKIQALMGNIGIAVDNVKALYKSTENWRKGWKTLYSKEGWSGLWKKITGAQQFQHGISTAVATGAGMSKWRHIGCNWRVCDGGGRPCQQTLVPTTRRCRTGRLGCDR